MTRVGYEKSSCQDRDQIWVSAQHVSSFRTGPLVHSNDFGSNHFGRVELRPLFHHFAVGVAFDPQDKLAEICQVPTALISHFKVGEGLSKQISLVNGRVDSV